MLYKNTYFVLKDLAKFQYIWKLVFIFIYIIICSFALIKQFGLLNIVIYPSDSLVRHYLFFSGLILYLFKIFLIQFGGGPTWIFNFTYIFYLGTSGLHLVYFQKNKLLHGKKLFTFNHMCSRYLSMSSKSSI